LKRKAVLGIMLTLLFMGILSLTFDIQPVEAPYPIIYIKADGSIDPSTANITSPDNVTYIFTADINASIVVEKDNIVVDGAGYTLQGTGSGTGIDLSYRNNVTLKNVEVTNFTYGIYLGLSSNNTVTGNTASTNALYGIYLWNSSNNAIISNNVSNNQCGLRLFDSTSNIFSQNTVSNNDWGMKLWGSTHNTIYHNNFINNTNQVDLSESSNNLWNNGYPSGGNYWSDYDGTDSYSGLYQNETGSDGIGDTPYLIDANETDNYLLLGMFSEFNATSEHHVKTICNSSISNFQYNGTAICFNVTGKTNTTGFCRICTPRALMNETYQVFVNGTEVQCNLLPCSNTTHSYLYFSYNHSTQEIIIIPEFPSFLTLPLFMIATLLAVIVYRRKHAIEHQD